MVEKNRARASLALAPYYHSRPPGLLAPYYHYRAPELLAPWPAALQNIILPCLPLEKEIQPTESQEFTRIPYVDKIHNNSTHHKIEEA
jgi:hypothetical protein